MSRQNPFHWSLLVLALTVTTQQVAQSKGAEPSGEAARLSQYTAPDGVTYFALGLKAASAPQAAGHDLVVLVNTSAGQTGVYREREMAALDTLLADLGPQDRLRLMAFDLKAVELTKGFVVPTSPEMQQALAKLQRRDPSAPATSPLRFRRP